MGRWPENFRRRAGSSVRWVCAPSLVGYFYITTHLSHTHHVGRQPRDPRAHTLVVVHMSPGEEMTTHGQETVTREVGLAGLQRLVPAQVVHPRREVLPRTEMYLGTRVSLPLLPPPKTFPVFSSPYLSAQARDGFGVTIWDRESLQTRAQTDWDCKLN
ncbi:hypothetical protein VTO42DRAFT_3100 [Malbranchea cinnamomea]